MGCSYLEPFYQYHWCLPYPGHRKNGGETNSGWKMDGNDEMVVNQAVLDGCLQVSWHLERCMLHQRLWSLQVSDDGDIFDTVYTVQARWSVVLWEMVINLINWIIWNHIDVYLYTLYLYLCFLRTSDHVTAGLYIWSIYIYIFFFLCALFVGTVIVICRVLDPL